MCLSCTIHGKYKTADKPRIAISGMENEVFDFTVTWSSRNQVCGLKKRRKLLVLARTNFLTAESESTHKTTLEEVLGARNDNGKVYSCGPKQKRVIFSNQQCQQKPILK